VGLDFANDFAALIQHLCVVGSWTGPGETDARDAFSCDRVAKCTMNRQPIFSPLMKALDVHIQPIAEFLEPPRLSLPVFGGIRPTIAPSGAERLQHIRLFCLRRMNLQAELAQTFLLKPPIDDIERGDFLGYEEYPFAASDAVCN